MNNISQTNLAENHISDALNYFFRTFLVASILKRVGASQTKHISALNIFRKLFELIFARKNFYMASILDKDKLGMSKSTVSRFLTSSNINWLRFLILLSKNVISFIEGLTSEKRIKVLIVDDTAFMRNSSRKVELLSKCFEHSKKIFYNGFRLLTLAWSDGCSLIPVAGVLLASNKAKNLKCPARDVDKRSCGYKARQLAQTSAPKAILVMLRTALRNGIKASHILFDSWFAFPSFILKIREIGLHVVAMVKKMDTVHYLYHDRKVTLAQIYRANRKRRGRSRYLLSVEVTLFDPTPTVTQTCPARLVFVRNRNNKKEYLVLLSTDMELSEEDIIRLYARRWAIEVFFKTCKSYLSLGKECQSTNYDAMNAYVAVVFARAMFLSVLNRMEQDDRTVGGMFYALCDEMSELSFLKALQQLFELFMNTVCTELEISEETGQRLLNEFFEHLPTYIQRTLKSCA